MKYLLAFFCFLSISFAQTGDDVVNNSSTLLRINIRLLKK
jgi:hypothetical protein